MATSSDVLWMLQSNALGYSHMDSAYKLTEFLDLQKIPYKPINSGMIANSPGAIESWDGPVFFYGSCYLVEQVAKLDRWNPGVYYKPERHSFEAFKHGYGELLLNGDSRVMLLGEYLDNIDKFPKFMFLRPTDDMKIFIGGIRSKGEAFDLLDPANFKSRATRETKIQIASIKELVSEWRTIIIDGKVATGSHYKAHKPKSGREYGTLPERVVEFAEMAAERYKPDEIFVLDVGELSDGSMRVVECNCINCSGFYWSDFYVIAREITEYVAATRGDVSG